MNNSMEVSNRKIADRAYDLAFEYERKYGSCPQCVLLAIQEVFGLKMDDVIKAGHALAGGAGMSGYGTCGALSGGIMALSFIHGRGRKDMGKDTFLRSYELAKRLYDKFVEEFGSCNCRDVQKKIFGKAFNLWDPDEYKEFDKAGGHTDKCTDVSGKVARWVAEILLEQSQKK